MCSHVSSLITIAVCLTTVATYGQSLELSNVGPLKVYKSDPVDPLKPIGIKSDPPESQRAGTNGPFVVFYVEKGKWLSSEPFETKGAAEQYAREKQIKLGNNSIAVPMKVDRDRWENDRNAVFEEDVNFLKKNKLQWVEKALVDDPFQANRTKSQKQIADFQEKMDRPIDQEKLNRPVDDATKKWLADQAKTATKPQDRLVDAAAIKLADAVISSQPAAADTTLTDLTVGTWEEKHLQTPGMPSDGMWHSSYSIRSNGTATEVTTYKNDGFSRTYTNEYKWRMDNRNVVFDMTRGDDFSRGGNFIHREFKLETDGGASQLLWGSYRLKKNR